MLTFYPEFEAPPSDLVDILLILDLSCSMKEEALEDLKKVSSLTLINLPSTAFFNVITFGYQFEELFPQSRPANKDNIQKALEYISAVSADMGSNLSIFLSPLHLGIT